MSEEEKKVPEESKPSGALSEARKSALLRYLAILFAFAFVLVAASLVIQMRSSNATILELNKTSSSALSNAETLQADNRSLQDQNVGLTDEIQAQNRQIAELEDQIEALQAETEAQASESETDKERIRALEKELSGVQIAYEALVTAESCDTREGNVTYSRAMETLEQNKEYLGPQALQEYEALLTEVQEENDHD